MAQERRRRPATWSCWRISSMSIRTAEWRVRRERRKSINGGEQTSWIIFGGTVARPTWADSTVRGLGLSTTGGLRVDRLSHPRTCTGMFYHVHAAATVCRRVKAFRISTDHGGLRGTWPGRGPIRGKSWRFKAVVQEKAAGEAAREPRRQPSYAQKELSLGVQAGGGQGVGSNASLTAVPYRCKS